MPEEMTDLGGPSDPGDRSGSGGRADPGGAAGRDQRAGDGGQDARVVVLVDDYDMITAAGSHPLEALLPFVPSARDLGLHVVVTRRVAGASRGLYEPFLLSLRESGATGLVLTGDREEGPLFPGVYAQPLPPGRGRWVRRGQPARLVQTALDAATR
jgi:S-DNA-T family DNA segregation ATPase FtsK/SpoIIIE